MRDGVAGYSGLQHCASVWVCPVCASRILVRRALEIGAVLGAAVAAGHALAFCTFTMRHNRGHRLDELWRAGSKAWGTATSGEGWQSAKDLGVVGWVRVWETGFGRNGWHVHVHFVLVLEQGVDLEQIVHPMWERWDRSLQRSGLDSLRVAQDWHVVEGAAASADLGGYLAKFADGVESDGLGLELTHALPGRAGKIAATRPTWSLLDHLVSTGEAVALDLWHEWERTSKGRRQVGWSQGLRERFAAVEEITDEEIVAEEIGTRNDDVVKLDAAGWRALVEVSGRPLQFLELLEGSGVKFALTALDYWGIPYETLNLEAK